MIKLQTLADKLRALADGEKIRDSKWDAHEYVYVKDDDLIGDNGEADYLELILDCDEIYEAPKDENLYEWIVKDNCGWVVLARLQTKDKIAQEYQDYTIKSGPYNPKDFKKE